MPNSTEFSGFDHWVSEKFRAAMKVRRISMIDLAAEAGIPYRTLQNHLYGRTSWPLPLADRVCEALQLRIELPLASARDGGLEKTREALAKVAGLASEASLLAVHGALPGNLPDSEKIEIALADALLAALTNISHPRENGEARTALEHALLAFRGRVS